MKIGLLSDTHGFLDERIFEWFKHCDEIWHAGDWGNIESTLIPLEKFKPLRGVYGNIDGQNIRVIFPEKLSFTVAGLKVCMVHICGYPGKYASGVTAWLNHEKPDLVIGGHSHILKVMLDKQPTRNRLFMNPGAAGIHGFHQVRTALRFDIKDKKPTQLEVIEMGPRTH